MSEEAPTPRSARYGQSVQWFVVLLLVVGSSAAAWKFLGTPSASTNVRPSQSESLTPTQRVLQQVGLQNSDLPAGEEALLARKGNKLADPTLAFCTGEFPSESRRLVRRLTTSWSQAQGSGRVTTDVVQYESVEAAAEALEEVRVELALCGAGAGATAEVADLPSSGRALLEGAVAARLSTLSDSGTSQRATLWQVRGNVLIVLSAELTDSSESNERRLSEFWRIGEALAARVNALDPVEVGYF